MKFKNKHYISGGVNSKENPLLQFLMWQCIDNMPQPKNYLQVFELSVKKGKQKITQIQEVPDYKREYLIISDTPLTFYLIQIVYPPGWILMPHGGWE